MRLTSSAFLSTLGALCLLMGISLADPGISVSNPGAGGNVSGTLNSLWLRKYPMIVYLEKVEGEFTPSKEKTIIDQKNKQFVPHLLPVLESSTVGYVNNDDTKHNVYIIRPDGVKVNLGTGTPGWSREQKMGEPGVYAHRCGIHDEMSAFVVSLQNPYFELIEKSPRKSALFKFVGVPPGRYKLRVWCEKFYNREGHKFNRPFDVTVKAGHTATIEVKP